MARFTNPSSVTGITDNYTPAFQTDNQQPSFDGPFIEGNYFKLSDIVNFMVTVSFMNVVDFGNGHYQTTLPFAAKSDQVFREGYIHDTDQDIKYELSGYVEEGSDVINLYVSSHMTTYETMTDPTHDVPFSFDNPIALTSQDLFSLSGSYESLD